MNAEKITVIAGDRFLTGFAADGVFTLTPKGPKAQFTEGSQGDGIYMESPANAYTLTLTFMPNSVSLPYLEELCENRVAFPVTVRDTSEDRLLTRFSENCRVMQMPELPGSASATTVTIEINMPEVKRS